VYCVSVFIINGDRMMNNGDQDEHERIMNTLAHEKELDEMHRIIAEDELTNRNRIDCAIGFAIGFTIWITCVMSVVVFTDYVFYM